MIAALKRLFEAPDEPASEEDLRLAGAVLLLEVAHADFELAPAEREAFKHSLAKRFSLSGKALKDLMDQATRKHRVTVSLHEQVSIINERYDARAKRQLIRDLWDIAYADGVLESHEEAVIRRLADLLYVPHRDFIKTKFEASGER